MEKYAFISYSHKNRDLVTMFVDALRNRQVNVWFDSQLQYGEYWDSLIMEKLENSTVVFIFISKQFAESKYCSKEFNIAYEKRKTIIPILLDKDVELPEDMAKKLHQIHHLSLYDCTGGYSYADIEKLCSVEAVKEISKDTYCSSGFGPKREIYSYNDKVDHAVFNSVKDHPKYGNEEEFLRVKIPGNEHFQPCRSLFLRPGKRYEFEIIVNNNGDYDLNQYGKVIANSVRAIVKLPDMIRPSKKGEIVALIKSTTAQPQEVWDSIELCSDRPIFLEFIWGSAVFERAHDGNRRVLPLDLFSRDGTYIIDFHKKANALVPAGDRFAGRILFTVKTYEDSARMSYTKSILSLDGQPISDVRYDEEFIVKTEFKHMGDIDIRNTCFCDTFPAGMVLIPHTTVMTNGANPNGLLMKDIININGFNTGLYGPGASCTLVYHAKFTDGKPGDKTIKGNVTHQGGFQNFFTHVNLIG